MKNLEQEEGKGYCIECGIETQPVMLCKCDFRVWKEFDHPIWGEGGLEFKIHEIEGITSTFPKKIWRKGDRSIIPPCTITIDKWELYLDGDIHRFETLEEAKNFKQ